MGPASIPTASLTTHPEQGFLEALDALRRALDELDAPSMIIGGVAVIALGVPRLTVDIDATVAAARVTIERLVETLERHRITPRIPDAVAFANARQVLLAVHEASGTPIDISLAWLSFEEEALAACRHCDYAGVRIRIPRPEDLLVYKVIASRPRDLEDAEGLLILHGAAMDLDRARHIVKQFAAALDDAERPQTLERLIRQSGLER